MLVESHNKKIRYLVIDFERRSEDQSEYTLISVSVRGLTKCLETVLALDIFLADSYKLHTVVSKIVKHEFLSLSNYVACAWKSEWFVEALHEALQLARDGNIEIVGHEVDHDIDILKGLFYSHGYPFFYEDREKGFENGQGKKPLFSHDKHDTRQICQSIRVLRESKNINSKSRLIDLAKYLNLNLVENNLHSSNYDCYLCTCCFIEWQKRLRMLEFYMERGAESAADNNDYFELNTNTAKNNDYLYLEKDDDLVPF